MFCQVDKATRIGETVNFIKTLEETKAQLEKKKLEQALARQAAAEATAGGASSFSVARTAHGMAALSDGWDPVPPQRPAAAGPVGFQTWSTPNVMLSVLNDEAVINVCVPRQRGLLTMVVSVLSKHGIDVISIQVGADDAQSFFNIYTRVSTTTLPASS